MNLIKRREILKKSSPYLYLFFAVVLMLGICGLAIVQSIGYSLTDLRFGVPESGKFIGFANYFRLINDSAFHNSIFCSAVYIVGSLILQILIGLMLALSVNKVRKGAQAIRTFLTIPVMVSGTVSAWMFYLLFCSASIGHINALLHFFGLPAVEWLRNTWTARLVLILEDTWRMAPFMFLIFYAALQTLPKEPFEAAEIDGATEWQKFRYITLPLLAPTMGVATLLRGIDLFKWFANAFIITQGGPARSTEILSFFTYRIGFKFGRTGYATALSVFVMIPPIIISIIYSMRKW